jgi:hypothetical protein
MSSRWPRPRRRAGRESRTTKSSRWISTWPRRSRTNKKRPRRRSASSVGSSSSSSTKGARPEASPSREAVDRPWIREQRDRQKREWSISHGILQAMERAERRSGARTVWAFGYGPAIRITAWATPIRSPPQLSDRAATRPPHTSRRTILSIPWNRILPPAARLVLSSRGTLVERSIADF